MAAPKIPPNETTPDPWQCPRCGAVDWKVIDSYVAGGKRRRVRRCKCQYIIETFEVPCPAGYVVVVVPEWTGQEII